MPKNKKPNEAKLLSFGFERDGNGYIYRSDMLKGSMMLTVSIDNKGEISAKVTDSDTDDEYILHRVPEAQGSFVGQVKTEYEAMLKEISEKCFDTEIFKTEQSKAVIAYVKGKYGDELEYLWQKFPDNAIVRRKDNRKWYAAVLTVSLRKLGIDSDEPAEIIDLRLKPEEMETTIDNVKYFPGYHMNKKHWITVCLDGSVPTEEIYRRIDESYRLAKGEGRL